MTYQFISLLLSVFQVLLIAACYTWLPDGPAPFIWAFAAITWVFTCVTLAVGR